MGDAGERLLEVVDAIGARAGPADLVEHEREAGAVLQRAEVATCPLPGAPSGCDSQPRCHAASAGLGLAERGGEIAQSAGMDQRQEALPVQLVAAPAEKRPCIRADPVDPPFIVNGANDHE